MSQKEKDLVVKSSLKLKKPQQLFKSTTSSGGVKKRKREPVVDLREIDLTIKKEASTSKKTSAELAFEKRQHETALERLKKKAAISHREKVEKFNKQMEELTEFNDIPKVSWTK